MAGFEDYKKPSKNWEFHKEGKQFVIFFVVMCLMPTIRDGIIDWVHTTNTKRRINNWVHRLHNSRDEHSQYFLWQGPLPERDGWDREILVAYHKRSLGEMVIVASAGPDGAFNTEDDIVGSAGTFSLSNHADRTRFIPTALQNALQNTSSNTETN